MSDEKELLPEDIDREAFEDYFSGVADEFDRKSAEWGFICGTMYGECTSPHTLAMEEALGALRYIIDLVDATLPELKIGGSAKAYNIYNDAVADSRAAIASLTKALGR